MKKLLATLLALLMLCGMSGAVAENADITGKVIIYTSMYQDICDMMSEALKTQFPNAEIEFFQGGTGTLQTKVAGEMESGKLGCDMLMVAEPAYSLELKEGGWLHPYVTDARNNLRFDYDEEGYWYPVRVCTMGFAYNPEMYSKEEIPTSYEAFAYDSQYQNTLSMSDPLTSGTAMATIAGLLDKFGEDYFVALGNQNVMIESGSSALAKLETGECSVVHGHDRCAREERQQQHRRLRSHHRLAPVRRGPELHRQGLDAQRNYRLCHRTLRRQAHSGTDGYQYPGRLGEVLQGARLHPHPVPGERDRRVTKTLGRGRDMPAPVPHPFLPWGGPLWHNKPRPSNPPCRKGAFISTSNG